jgi:parallel beta-helix repeat protein
MRQLAPFILLSVAAACGGDDDPCAGVAGTCVLVPSGADRAEIQELLITIESGSTLAFPAGRFRVDGELSLDVDNVTIKGAGMNRSILSFAEQTTGAQGFLVTADAFTIHDIGLEDSPGDLLKIEGADGVTIRRVRAEWTRGPHAQNGAYGLYPVQCSNVLIEESVAIAASDAGIYVGQSDNIIVTGNTARHNVAGIEIENSTRADVFGNEAYENTGGVLVFNLPGLPVSNGHGTRVFDNVIRDNNTVNFAPAGNIVGKVPTGTGIALLAARDVEIFGNTIENHASINLGIVNYTIIDTFEDPNYDPWPYSIYIHDNVFRGESTSPTGEMGAMLILALLEVQDSVAVPDITWDGQVSPDHQVQDDPTRLEPGFEICIKNNGDANFGNLHWPNNDGLEAEVVADITTTPHDCTRAPLPAVILQ